MVYTLRIAEPSDVETIQCLIEESVMGLSSADYSLQQIEGALLSAWGVDTQLIADKTYFVVEAGEQVVGCGGWSYRETLFGSDREQSRSSAILDPRSAAAKIRAFFVKPAYARKGIGTLLMARCEEAARHMGFHHLELMATLPGLKLYVRHGFIPCEAIEHPVGDNLFITFIPMKKTLDN